MVNGGALMGGGEGLECTLFVNFKSYMISNSF